MDTKIYTDADMLHDLNDAYLEAVVAADVDRFGRLLADDFLCSAPDGALLDKRAFIERTAAGRTLERLAAADVRIRILDRIAIIHAETSYTTVSGEEGRGRYTDIWAKRGAQWLAVAAHVTRL